MRNIQLGMDVAKQRRRLTHLAEHAPETHRGYLDHLITLFDAEVAAGRPTPASEFIPRYREEFDL